jgi:hypothetical protein
MDLAALIPTKQYRYYFECLSKEEAAVYDAMLSGLLHYSKEIVCRGCTVSQVQKIYHFLKLDVPELFYIKNIRIRYFTEKASHCTVTPEYRFTISQTHDTLISMSRHCRELVDKYKQCSDFQKEKAIHDYIAMTVKYKDTEAPYSHEAPGAVLYQIGVCEGIAKAFKYLSDQLGLQSVVVFGASNEQGNECGHAWNLVKVNGVFYHIDTTFDTTISSSCIRYDYFNLSDADIQSSHHWDDELPECPKTFGIYEKMGCYFNRGRALASFIRNASPMQKTFVFKLPRTFLDDEMIVASIKNLLQSNIQCGSQNYKQYSLSYNLKQLVFQVDLI